MANVVVTSGPKVTDRSSFGVVSYGDLEPSVCDGVDEELLSSGCSARFVLVSMLKEVKPSVNASVCDGVEEELLCSSGCSARFVLVSTLKGLDNSGLVASSGLIVDIDGLRPSKKDSKNEN